MVLEGLSVLLTIEKAAGAETELLFNSNPKQDWLSPTKLLHLLQPTPLPSIPMYVCICTTLYYENFTTTITIMYAQRAAPAPLVYIQIHTAYGIH
jgi:hypothetical protein